MEATKKTRSFAYDSVVGSTASKSIAVLLISFTALTLAGEVLAKTKSNGASDGVLRYKSFTSRKIEEVLRAPLTLENCIGVALTKNLPLRVAQGELAAAQANLSGTYGKFLPVFSLQAKTGNSNKIRPFDPNNAQDPTELSFERNSVLATMEQSIPTGALLTMTGDLKRDIDSPDEFGAPPTRTKNRGFNVEFTQPLLRGAWPTVSRSEISLARYDRDKQEMLLIDQRLETVLSVKVAYFELLRNRELVKVNEAAVQRDSTLLKASESKVIAKVATRRDVLSAEIQLAEDLATLFKSQTAYEIALDNLKELMGLELGAPVEIAEANLAFVSVILDEAELSEEAFRINPFIQHAEIAVESSQLRLKVARNTLLPQLDLTATYANEFDSNTDLQADLRTTGWEASINLSYPFFNKTASADAQRMKVLVSQEQDQLAHLQRQIRVDIRSIVKSVYSSAHELKALQRTIDAAQQKVDFASTMFNLGRASNLDITDSQEDLLRAETKYIDKLADYHIQLSRLERLTGKQIGDK